MIKITSAFTAVLLAALVMVGVAQAAPTPLASVTPSNWYGWCGGQSALQELQPDATPPATPTSCGEYAGSSGSLTVQFSPVSGRLAVSIYASNQAVSTSAKLVVDGAQVGSAIPVPENSTGWVSFPATWIQSSDTVQVVLSSSWWQASGSVRVLNVHGEILPWSSPNYSMFGTPGNWATTPIPANVSIQGGASPYGSLPLSQEVSKELQGEANGVAYVNEGSYSAPFYYQPLSTPLEPVKLCQWWNGAGNNCVANAPLWRMFMGLGNNAQPNWTTGQCASNCTSIGGGVAMTSDVIGASGTDGAAVVCLGGGDSGDPPWMLPNFTRPDGQKMEGNCWEMWDLRKDPAYDPTQPVSVTNTEYEVAFGMHETGFIQQLSSQPIDNTYGHQLDTFSGKYCPRTPAGAWKCGGMTDALAQQWFGPDVLTPGAPDSTTMLGSTQQGVTAAELPLITDVIQQHDCQAVLDGSSDYGHAIGVQLAFDRAAGYGYSGAWWPAGNSDGNQSHMAVVEGMRLFFPSSVAMPSGLPHAAQVFFHNTQRYGIVVDDTTGGGTGLTLNPDGSYASGGALNIRVEPPVRGQADACSTLGTPSSLVGIPWNQLQLIQSTQGNADANPNPTG